MDAKYLDEAVGLSVASQTPHTQQSQNTGRSVNVESIMPGRGTKSEYQEYKQNGYSADRK